MSFAQRTLLKHVGSILKISSKFPPDEDPGAVQAGLDGRDGKSHCLGRLLGGQPLHVSEDEDDLVVLG